YHSLEIPLGALAGQCADRPVSRPGVSLILATFLLTRGIRDSFIVGATDYSLLVGAKSNPTQLVLGTIFRMDVATPNMPYTVYEQLRDDARVERAVPVALAMRIRAFAMSPRRPSILPLPPGGAKPLPWPPDDCGTIRHLSSRPMKPSLELRLPNARACKLVIPLTKARRWPSIPSPLSVSSGRRIVRMIGRFSFPWRVSGA